MSERWILTAGSLGGAFSSVRASLGQTSTHFPQPKQSSIKEVMMDQSMSSHVFWVAGSGVAEFIQARQLHPTSWLVVSTHLKQS